MVDMLSRAWIEDKVVESEEEEVPEDYFTSGNVFRVCGLHEFHEEEYDGEALHIGRMLHGKGNPEEGKTDPDFILRRRAALEREQKDWRTTGTSNQN